MRNYLRENIRRYRHLARSGDPIQQADFSSRGFLEEVIPRLRLGRDRRRVLELGTGTGPGAIYLAERGFDVHAIDVIPEAIAEARCIASERGLEVRFEVMDVTRIPRHGPAYDLIVDSYCLQGIVLDADRKAVFRAVKARLDLTWLLPGEQRHVRLGPALQPTGRWSTGATGRVFDRYDEASLLDPDTDIYYESLRRQGAGRRSDLHVNESWYYPFRRYRTAPRLRAEVESYGFRVLLQTGEPGARIS